MYYARRTHKLHEWHDLCDWIMTLPYAEQLIAVKGDNVHMMPVYNQMDSLDKAINMAPHYGRTRKMRCPACGKKTWQKKVISKE